MAAFHNDLARWLGEQLDEDERIARGADPGPWKSESLGRHDQAAIKLAAPTSLIQFDGSRAAANGAHVARHDPARVLREIDAKRKILALWQAADTQAASDQRYAESYDTSPDGFTACREDALDTALSLLASVYADRDGYQESWRQ